jgi:hypothetical protein
MFNKADVKVGEDEMHGSRVEKGLVGLSWMKKNRWRRGSVRFYTGEAHGPCASFPST